MYNTCQTAESLEVDSGIEANVGSEDASWQSLFQMLLGSHCSQGLSLPSGFSRPVRVAAMKLYYAVSIFPSDSLSLAASMKANSSLCFSKRDLHTF